MKNQEKSYIFASPLIIISNHKSYADHFILAASLSKSIGLPIRPVAKASLFEAFGGFFGKLLNAFGAIQHTKILKIIKILRSGGTILIYPEGGIRKLPGIHNLEAGTAFLAIKTDAWILPIAISGLDNFSIIKTLMNPLSVFYKTKVRVSFGKPFPGKTAGDIISLTAIIKTKLENLYESSAV